MTVANILKGKRTAVFWVPPVLAVGAAAERLRSAGVGVMIVSSDGESLLGLISERDIAHGLAAHGAALPSLKVSDLMARSVITCTPEDDIAEIARIMTMRRIRQCHGRRKGCGRHQHRRRVEVEDFGGRA